MRAVAAFWHGKLPLVAEDEPQSVIQTWLQELGVLSEEGN